MKSIKSKSIGRSGPAVGRRKSVGAGMAPQDWIRTEPLDGHALPLVVTPAIDGMDLVEWAGANREYVEELLWKHKSLLFRGFDINKADTFSRFVHATSDQTLEYKDRSTPRETRGQRIYTSTVYPADQSINLHNEGSYWITWALKIYFCCSVAAETGGETPIADVGGVYRRIDPAVREPFEQKGVMYVRNYNDGFGLPWEEVFQTSDRDEVEAYCRKNRISFEWKGENRLRTRQVRPAVRTHPKTGQKVWFNHGAFFHVSSLDPAVRDTLLAEFGEDELPYQTFYGDGSPIDPGVVAHIHDCYLQERVIFPWQEGDALLQDNMSVAHARQPYTGDREVLVALTDPYTGSEV